MKKIALISSLFLIGSGLFAQEKDGLLKDIELNFGATGIIQGSTFYKNNVGKDKNYIESSYSYDLEIKKTLSENSSINMHLQAGNGNGLDNYIATYSGLNADANNDSYLMLTEIWFEQQIGKFAFKAGKFGMGQDFDINNSANSETDQFLAGSLVNNSALEFPSDNGASLMLRYNPVEEIGVIAGMSESDSDWDKGFQNAFYAAGLEYKSNFLGQEGNWRLYGWYNGTDRTELIDANKSVSSNQGFALSADQSFEKLGGIFLRYGMQDDKVSELSSTISAGLSLSGSQWNREEDNLAIAIALNQTTQDLNTDDEYLIETYYNLKLNDNFNISPDLQLIINPLGDSDRDAVTTFGIRTQLNF
jgi:carbohydrate-selective porin OprB